MAITIQVISPVNSGNIMELRMGQDGAMGGVGAFEIRGGIGATVDITRPGIADFSDPFGPIRFPYRVSGDPIRLTIQAKTWGSFLVTITGQASHADNEAVNLPAPGGLPWLASHAEMRVNITDPRRNSPGGTQYKIGYVPHHQAPCTDPGCWDDICSNITNPLGVKAWGYTWIHPTPRDVVNMAKAYKFGDKPVALKHLDWYLQGTGDDYNEDENLANWMKADRKARKQIGDKIKWAQDSGHPDPKVLTNFDHFEQDRYDDENYSYSYGDIDRLDIFAIFNNPRKPSEGGTVKLWFEDCYEWHPVFHCFNTCKTDIPRETNFVHAALVQMKLEGARDFLMRGEATLPLESFFNIHLTDLGH